MWPMLGRPRAAKTLLVLASTLLLGSCTLIDLSELQGGASTASAGGASAAASGSVATGTTGQTASSSTGDGGAGGAPDLVYRLFVVGGRKASLQPLDSLYVATLLPDGELGPYTIEHLPETRQNHQLAIFDGFMFVIGGFGTVGGMSTGERSSTLVADLGSNGMTPTWQTLDDTLPSPQGRGAMGIVGHRIFLGGGNSDDDESVKSKMLVSDVSNGTLTPFTEVGVLPNPMFDTGGAIANSAMVISGGDASNNTHTRIWPIDADGNLVGSGPIELPVAHSRPRATLQRQRDPRRRDARLPARGGQ